MLRSHDVVVCLPVESASNAGKQRLTYSHWCVWEACSNTHAVFALQGSWDMMLQGEAGPALWSAEEPNLYILVLSLIAPDGSHVESESCQVRTQN